MPKHLRKISEETLHENPWWKYKHDTYEKPNGQVGDYFYGETPGGAAMIVPVLPDGKLVLTLQHRYLEDKQSIEFPAGGLKFGQLPIDAAKGELIEETGFVATDIVKVGVFSSLNGLFRDECHIFIAHVIVQGEQHLDDTEEIDILYRKPEDLEEMIRNNEIWDGMTMATWSLVRHHLM
ncbi:MAG: hypothetical protein COY69_01920 [Candidatus Magasanikbacteria bacterium CG_4_10_14_0_8_um_filter_32_14]|uniref:Nudix hydrolase domain-containing protein n=2 Tax=Candidatus Magasanikiibacteriota TaxID=1752731 RepID=A0A2M7RA02_9BACT|nr:MAG: hypothetical protein AUJ23_03140 [Candidatus Magasanikbacteria bacterium CG1_02_32_51]PIY93367.1 MAG: hypothetical protein COY69_01920 [Candidatus Magasanikbacteria bacterium CG_4_10_14_0_8_um_filter_32_14]